MKHFFNLCVKLTKLENMKSLLIIFAALQLFVQHREVILTKNDLVYQEAVNCIGKKIGSGMCGDFVYNCLDKVNPSWKEVSGHVDARLEFEVDSVVYSIHPFGRWVETPSVGDILYLSSRDTTQIDHVAIFMSMSNDTIYCIDQNSGDRIDDSSYVDATYFTNDGSYSFIFFRPM